MTPPKSKQVPAVLVLLALSTLNPQLSTVFAQGTASFTYEGRLTASGNGANGRAEVKFNLNDALSGGNQVGHLPTNTAVTASRCCVRRNLL